MFKVLKYFGLVAVLFFISCNESKKTSEKSRSDEMEISQNSEINFDLDEVNKRIDVKIGNELFTSYIFDGKTPKPILYPLITKSGIKVTRGFPYDSKPGERVDHPHHVGLWFNYGDVNGLDFWNNSYAIPENEKHKYGSIIHQEIVELDDKKGIFSTKAIWQSLDEINLIEETTKFVFSEVGNTRVIDRITSLKALNDVSLKDNKEGMLGIRVARELELPSDEPAEFTDAEGNVTEVKVLDNEGVNGNYFASGGLTGNDVWGTRNKWVKLESTIKGAPVSITILDNKDNAGYPTYWHSRGYGLFAANPLGQAIFSEGKNVLDYKLLKGESATFKYRILIHSGTVLSKEEITNWFNDFNNL